MEKRITLDDEHQVFLVDQVLDNIEGKDGPFMERTIPAEIVEELGADLRNSISSKDNERAVFAVLAKELPWAEVELLLESSDKPAARVITETARRLAMEEARAVQSAMIELEKGREAAREMTSGRVRKEFAKIAEEEDPAVTTARARAVVNSRLSKLARHKEGALTQQAEATGLKNINYVIFSFVTSDKVMLVHSMPAKEEKATSWGFFRVSFDSKAGGLTPTENATAALRTACTALGVSLTAGLGVWSDKAFSGANPLGSGRSYYHPFLVTVPSEVVVDLKVTPKYMDTQWVPLNCDLLASKFKAVSFVTGAGALVRLNKMAAKVITVKLACPEGADGEQEIELQPDEMTRVLTALPPTPPAPHAAVAALAPSSRTAPAGRAIAKVSLSKKK